MRARNKQVVIKLNDEEYMHFQKQLELSGLTKADFIRKLIMQKDIKPRLPEEYAKVVYELSKIGGNINQIAHRSNSARYLTHKDAMTAVELMKKCWEQVQSLK